MPLFQCLLISKNIYYCRGYLILHSRWHSAFGEVCCNHRGDRKNKKNQTIRMLLEKASRKESAEFLECQCSAMRGASSHPGRPAFMLSLEEEGAAPPPVRWPVPRCCLTLCAWHTALSRCVTSGEAVDDAWYRNSVHDLTKVIVPTFGFPINNFGTEIRSD